jgi:hypothetical protein
MEAVLEDAARAYWETADEPDAVSHRDVAHWFASDAFVWPFSFVNVCRALDLEPATVRATLAGLHERDAA